MTHHSDTAAPVQNSYWILLNEALETASDYHIACLSEALQRRMPNSLGIAILRLVDDYQALVEERTRG